MTATVTIRDATSRLAELVDRAERGEETIVTRHGRVVARIAPPKAVPEPATPPTPARSEEELAALMARARALREDIRRTSGPISRDEIRAWIREGQR